MEIIRGTRTDVIRELDRLQDGGVRAAEIETGTLAESEYLKEIKQRWIVSELEFLRGRIRWQGTVKEPRDRQKRTWLNQLRSRGLGK